MPKKIIMDVDTGSDDAVAIMAAVRSQDIELLACCTVFGNLAVEHTTQNTLRLLDALGHDAPVYKGCAAPMVKTLNPARIPPPPPSAVVDGKELRMHYTELELPETKRKAESVHAVAFYIETLRRATQPITIVATAPLTNLGVALSLAPDIVASIEEIVIMGGGDRITAVTIGATANIYNDPEAAQIVATCGAPVLWTATDATYTACLTYEDCQRFRALGTFEGDFTAQLVEQRIEIHNAAFHMHIPNSAPVHDALCVCALIDPKVLSDVQRVHVNVGLEGYGEGKTIIDRRPDPAAPNCRFAFEGDRVRFADMLCRLFAPR